MGLVNGWSLQGRKVERRPERHLRGLRVSIFPKNNNERGMSMITRGRKYLSCENAQRIHDVLLVSSFAVWAMVLGFAPVLTYRLLMN